MTIIDLGKVGIGTTSPTKELDVIGNISLSKTDTSDVVLTMANTEAINTFTNEGTGGFTFDSDNTSQPTLFKNDGTPFISFFPALLLLAFHNETDFTNNNVKNIDNLTMIGDLKVDVNTFFVDSSANSVGIGTITPSTKLEVSGGNVLFENTAGNLKVSATGTSGEDSLITIQTQATGGDPRLSFDISGVIGYAMGIDNDDNFFKITNGSAGLTTNEFVMNNGGDIGIGIANPTSKLHVLGNTLLENITGRLEVCASGTSGQESKLLIQTQATGGDPLISFDISGVAGYSLGIDNDDNFFKITNGGAGLTTNEFVMNNGGDIGIGIANPTSLLHLHRPSASQTQLQITNSLSGATSSDGLNIALNMANQVEIRNRENTEMKFYTNNTCRMSISADGDLTLMNNIVGTNNTFVNNVVALFGSSGNYAGDGLIVNASFVKVFDYSYTPKNTGAKIIITFHSEYAVDGTGADTYHLILKIDGIDKIDTREFYRASASGGGHRGSGLFPIRFIHTSADTDAIAITINIIRTTGDDTLTVIGADSSLVIEELSV